MADITHWHSLEFEALSLQTLYDIMALRQAVFVVEQDCPYQDMDGFDQVADHLFCSENGAILAYQRCLPPGSTYEESSIGRIIVAPQARGRQMGRELVQRGIDHNRQRWPSHAIRIGAQAHLAEFYGSLGFVIEGDGYVEDGIPHVHMVLSAA